MTARWTSGRWESPPSNWVTTDEDDDDGDEEDGDFNGVLCVCSGEEAAPLQHERYECLIPHCSE